MEKCGCKVCERFWPKVQKVAPQDCWLWIGANNKKGYGNFWDGQKQVKPHRFIYRHIMGNEIPEGYVVMHTCDRPGCVQPEHLRCGTSTDNNKDMGSKGRNSLQRHMRGPNGRKLTREAIIIIRQSPLTSKELAQLFNVHWATIHKTRKGKIWKVLPPVNAS